VGYSLPVSWLWRPSVVERLGAWTAVNGIERRGVSAGQLR
jgi:hypothetical protein